MPENMTIFCYFGPDLNHGSYGAPPKMVMDAFRQWQHKSDERPDEWFRYDVYGYVDKEISDFSPLIVN